MRALKDRIPAALRADVARATARTDADVQLARYEARSAIAYTGISPRLVSLRQESPLRFLLPHAEAGEPTTVVVANTAGGVVGGDRLSFAVSAEDGSELLVLGQAAEKIYRSRGDEAQLAATYSSRSSARLEVLPQGTILFDGAQLGRRTRLETEPGATLLYGEILHFGRSARAEEFDSGHLHDHTEIHRAGRLVHTDVLRLSGDVARQRRASSSLAGARACAVAYLVDDAAPRFLPELRERAVASGSEGVRFGAGCFDEGVLVVRLLARDGSVLRSMFGSIWAHLRRRVLGRPERMPRIWSI